MLYCIQLFSSSTLSETSAQATSLTLKVVCSKKESEQQGCLKSVLTVYIFAIWKSSNSYL